MEKWGRWAALLLLTFLTVRFAQDPSGSGRWWGLLNMTDLVFHEAGHVIFSPFGRFLMVLGGSLFQVLVPIACAVALWRQDDQNSRFGAAICTWWAAQSLLNVSPYIADARALRLTLIGGRTGAEVEGHDWEYLLTAMGWLHLDTTLGRAVHVISVLAMLAAIGWAGTLLLQQNADQEKESL
jgi:hypothetical protein